MSKLPDGTNPYGRLLDIMRQSAQKEIPSGLVMGEYRGGGRFQIGANEFESEDVLIIQNTIMIDGATFKMPGLEEQKHTVKKNVTIAEETAEVSFDVKVPELEEGDTVIAYQFDDEEYVILGVI